jgi:hypothetical protein
MVEVQTWTPQKTIQCDSSNNSSICGPLSHKYDKDNLMALKVYQPTQ